MNTKIFSTPQSKIHSVWYPSKDYQVQKKQINTNQSEGEKINWLKPTHNWYRLELSNKNIFKTFNYVSNIQAQTQMILKTQIKCLEFIISEMKNTLDGISGRWDIAEEKITELEVIAIKTIQN